MKPRVKIISPVPAELASAIGHMLRDDDRREVEEVTGKPYDPLTVWECVLDSVCACAAVRADDGRPICVWGGSAPSGWLPGQPFVIWELGTELVSVMRREFVRLSPVMAEMIFDQMGSETAVNVVPSWYSAARRWLVRIGAEFENQPIEANGKEWNRFVLRKAGLKGR